MKKEEMQEHAFQSWYGRLLINRRKAHPEEPVRIDDNLDLLEDAFRAGWAWAATLDEDARHRAER